MRESRDTFPETISQFPLISTIVELYCGTDKDTSLQDDDISRLISCGLDYTLANSSWRSYCLLDLHEHLRRVQHQIVEQISSIVAQRYKIVVSQSFAYGVLDAGAVLNGYKSDLDILVADVDMPQFKRDLAAAGHVRRVLDAETGLPIALDETDEVDFVPGKAMAGTFLIPLNIQSFEVKTQAYIRTLAGTHQPLNINARGEAFLLYGIDAISFYGSKPVDLDLCSLRADCSLPVQELAYNVAVAFRRLYSVVSEGILKPNLLFLICRMLKQTPLVEVERQLEEPYKQFFHAFVWYHQAVVLTDVPWGANVANMSDEEIEHIATFSELYSSLDEYIKLQNV